MSLFVPRADRLRLDIPINYRQQGDEEWFLSHIVNLSESGVLFGPSELRPGASVEVILSSPVPIGARASGPHKCAGTVIRTTEIGAVAARFDSWKGLLES
jgi:hypothetical protein